jgi:hypothetical protein
MATTYFSYGLFASLVFGCAATLPLLFAHPGAPRNQGALAVTGTKLASVPLWPAHGAVAPDAEISSFELPIRRSDRANAAFPLQITGARPTDITSVVLHDLPEQAWLSKGRRQDEHTWVLRPTTLRCDDDEVVSIGEIQKGHRSRATGFAALGCQQADRRTRGEAAQHFAAAHAVNQHVERACNAQGSFVHRRTWTGG